MKEANPDAVTETPCPSDLLAGVRVVSLAQQYPGPYCTMLLADLGADVILVEQPRTGDPARGGSGMSPFFAALNRNKRSVTLDLKDPESAQSLWSLLRTADVLVEGFRPGVMERLGFSPVRVRQELPGLVYASISGYGQDGPDRATPGHDLSYVARAGWLSSIDSDTLTRYQLPVAAGDLSSAMFAAFAVAAALVRRAATGTGAYIDVSMADGLVSWFGTTLEPQLNRTAGDHPGTARLGREPAYGIFRCADGHFLTLSIAHEDHFWRNLCDALGTGGLRSLDSPARRRKAGELRRILEGCFLARSASEWVALLQAADVPCGPVASLDDVIADPQFSGRGMFPEGPGEDGRPRRYVANPLIIDGTRPPVRRPAPHLGIHNDEVLGKPGRHPDGR